MPDFIQTMGIGTIKNVRHIQSPTSQGLEIEAEFFIGNDKYPQTERIVMWDDHATRNAYAQSGMRCFFIGRPKLRSWIDQKTGEKKYRSNIEVNKFFGQFEIITDPNIDTSSDSEEDDEDYDL